MSVSSTSLIALDCDSNGTLYGVTAPTKGLGAVLMSLNIRQELLAADQGSETPHESSFGGGGGGRSISLEGATANTILHTTPRISFHVVHMSVLESGHQILLGGYSLKNQQRAVAAVVDVHGGFPCDCDGNKLSSAAAGSQSSRRVPTAPQHHSSGSAPQPAAAGQDAALMPAARHRQCALHLIDSELLENRPGLLIHQLSWHPHNDHTLLMLTSDNTLRIYSTTNPSSSSTSSSTNSSNSTFLGLSRAQQTLRLQLDNSTNGHYGLHQPQSLATVTAFAFGPMLGWGAFTVYILGSHGGVYGLCPVAPFGMKVSSSVIQQCADAQARLRASALSGSSPDPWILAAFGADAALNPAAQSVWTVRGHLLEEQSPALQGPLNEGCTSLPATCCAATAIALSCQHLLTFHTPDPEPLTPSTTSTAATAPAITAGTAPSAAAPLPRPVSSSSSSSSAAASMGSGPVPIPDQHRARRKAAASTPTCVTALVTAFTDGHVFAHATLSAPQPAWNDGTPQCSLDGGGRVDAVRCTCEVTQTAWVPLLSGAPPQATGAAAAAAAAGGVPGRNGSLELLDMLEVEPWVAPGLPIPAQHAARGTAAAWGGGRQLALADGGGGGGSSSATPGRSAAAAVMYGLQGLAARAANFDYDDDSEEDGAASEDSDDGEYVVLGRSRQPQQQRQQQLQLKGGLQPPGGGLKLLGAGDRSPANLWVAHNGGCWAVTLPWLSVISARRAAAAAALLQSTGVHRGDAGESGDDVMEGLPPVVLRAVDGVAASEQRTGGDGEAAAAVSGCCVMRDAFLGDGALLLQPSGGLIFCKPPGRMELQLSSAHLQLPPPPPPTSKPALPSPSSSSATAASSSSSAAAAAAAAGGGDGSGLDSESSRLAQIEAHVTAVYGKILKGPAGTLPPPPSGPAPTTAAAAAAASLARLHAATSALRTRHIEFAHTASDALLQRQAALAAEASGHAAAAAQLRTLAASVVAQQEELNVRVRRAVALQRNLSGRAGLLSMLHWTVARPFSDAEKALTGELTVLEQQQENLRVTCAGLVKKGKTAVAERRAAVAGTATPAAGAKPGGRRAAPALSTLTSGRSVGEAEPTQAQLNSAYAVVLQQTQMLDALRATMKQLDADMECYKGAQTLSQ
ncbi:MAG: hypothetical protein WDW38_005890 [Sanguina aurantia]